VAHVGTWLVGDEKPEAAKKRLQPLLDRIDALGGIVMGQPPAVLPFAVFNSLLKPLMDGKHDVVVFRLAID
jgi:hypothetical protein